MSEEFDDFGDLAVDDEFLAAVDQIEKQAVGAMPKGPSCTLSTSNRKVQSQITDFTKQYPYTLSNCLPPKQLSSLPNSTHSNFTNHPVMPLNPITANEITKTKSINKILKQSTGDSHMSQTTLWGMFDMDQEELDLSGNRAKKSPNTSSTPSKSVYYNPKTINTWIYPTNYPIRDYQFNIVSKALFENTLVALPTGLGKTFVAAVIMYNHYRWFPNSKIVFMAPTKPLVAQQIEACHNICGISQDDTAELTGAQSPDKRKHWWLKKKVFFLTPQALQNDLIRGTCPAEDIVCLVIDEAHRSRGEFANCVAVRELYARNPLFRILALSATPGVDLATVQEVVNNLMISNIELRTEESIDIRKYTHDRRIDIIVVPFTSRINEISKQFCTCMEPYTTRLFRMQVIWEKDPQKVSKYMLILARNKFRSGSASMPPEQRAGVEGDFGICLALSHAHSLLRRHGIRPFYSALLNMVQEAKDGKKISRARQDLLKNSNFVDLMGHIEKILNESIFSGHPKLEKLVTYVMDYFVNHEACNDNFGNKDKSQTRVMIFAEYRESVEEIVKALNFHFPIIRPMSFVGQATKKSKKGFTQKEQMAVLTQFKQGGYNVIVSTSIGEEGLDIGEVDLIICYDSLNSPIRLLQRMGRTGRKRQGRICMLLSEGKEEQMYKQSQNSYKTIQRAIASGSKITLFKKNPRLLPKGVHPVCIKKSLVIPEYEPRETKRSRQKIAMPSSHQINEADEAIEEQYAHFLNSFSKTKDPNISLSKFPKHQTTPTSTCIVLHSRRTDDYIDLMSAMETLGFINNEDDQYGLQLQDYLNLDDIVPFRGSHQPTTHLYSKKLQPSKDSRLFSRSKSAKIPRKSIEEKLPDLEDDADDFMIMQGVERIFDVKSSTAVSISRPPSSSSICKTSNSYKSDSDTIGSTKEAPIEIDLEGKQYKTKFHITPRGLKINLNSGSHIDTKEDALESNDDFLIDASLEQELVALMDSHEFHQDNTKQTNTFPRQQKPFTVDIHIKPNLIKNSSKYHSKLNSRCGHSIQNTLNHTTFRDKRSKVDTSEEQRLELDDFYPINNSKQSKVLATTPIHPLNDYQDIEKNLTIQAIPSFPKDIKFGNWREIAKVLSSSGKSTGDRLTRKSIEDQWSLHTREELPINGVSMKLSSGQSKLDQFRFKRRKC
ncbi:3'-5' DNA helicase [Basidiobolus ranarum]|uniref:ATP-dependent DNA helicase n=1 Tax=Basidiobolus ranarum TaxID=34480 RepID=A0ABR2VS05_9FUNG